MRWCPGERSSNSSRVIAVGQVEAGPAMARRMRRGESAGQAAIGWDHLYLRRDRRSIALFCTCSGLDTQRSTLIMLRFLCGIFLRGPRLVALVRAVGGIQ